MCTLRRPTRFVAVSARFPDRLDNTEDDETHIVPLIGGYLASRHHAIQHLVWVIHAVYDLTNDLPPRRGLFSCQSGCDLRLSSSLASRHWRIAVRIKAALQRLKLLPHEAVVIGDTPYDAEAARKAGLRMIGVQTSGTTTANGSRVRLAARGHY